MKESRERLYLSMDDVLIAEEVVCVEGYVCVEGN